MRHNIGDISTFPCPEKLYPEIRDMRMLEPGDKIDKTYSGQVIYTMIVTHVTGDRAFADIPGGSDPYIFLRQCDGVVQNIYPGSEGYVVHGSVR